MARPAPPGGPPQGPGPNPAIYRLMGEANIFRMMSDFYRELEKSEIRYLFPPDMEAASRKSAAFFVTVLGGPPLYMKLYGPPRMRARHLPFEIDEQARRVFRQWQVESAWAILQGSAPPPFEEQS